MPSTVIRRFAYDPGAHRLVIEFLSGRRYAYFDVPPRVYEEMCRARSRGSYFNRRIRDHFAFADMDGAAGRGHDRHRNT